MPKETPKPDKPGEKGSPSDTAGAGEKKPEPQMVPAEELAKLKKQYEDSRRGFNEKAQLAAERGRQIETLQAKIEAIEAQAQTAVDAETRRKRIEQLAEELGSDRAAELQLEAEERQKKLETSLGREVEDLKKFKRELEYERYEMRVDKALVKAGVDVDTELGSALKALVEKNSTLRNARGERYESAFTDEVTKAAERYKKYASLNVGDETDKEKESGKAGGEETKIPTGGETPKETPKKPKPASDEERIQQTYDSYANYAERSEG